MSGNNAVNLIRSRCDFSISQQWAWRLRPTGI
jgi:hypothetical protein